MTPWRWPPSDASGAIGARAGLEGPADLAEDFDDWMVDSDRELIWPFCQTHEEPQLGVIRRDWSTDAT
jgi:hypothetical protein